MNDKLAALADNHDLIDFERGRSLWQDAWARLAKNRLAMFGLAVISFMVVIAILTPWLAPYGYEEQNLELGAAPPSAQHWLGTDVHGRDLLTRLMYGGRISLLVGFAATSVALLIGVPLPEAAAAGSLIGQKLIINEFYAANPSFNVG